MKKLTMDSKIREIYQNPVGHDILHKLLLQMNKSERLIKNPIVSHCKLKTVSKLTKKMLSEEFYHTFLELLNSEEDQIDGQELPIQKQWWKEAVFYQIYPVSFMDSDHDGYGDLNGIRSKLDYLHELGVDVIWLSPIYDSPYDDNGYDIRNYYEILSRFGTMEQFDALLEEVHSKGMKLIMDLVVNHTSDEHPWFTEALSNPESKYHDYYLFKTSENGKEPNNWTSFFSGPAWNYYPKNKEYALHLFSKKQMDLNWDNKEVREDVAAMVRWWLEKGVDGFRLDVINYISKREGLPMGDETIGQMMGYTGVEHYFYGPNLHQYLHELHEKAFAPYHAFSVGETPGIGMKMSQLLTADNRKELDMVFSFDQLETPGHVRFDDYRYDLNYLKSYLIDWMKHYGNRCWMSLFYENHDNPRMISKVNPAPEYRAVLGKLLALIQFTMKGTPFIYQGQEIGSVNQEFSSMEELRDVESINLYRELCQKITKEEAFRKVKAGTRDHARTPMLWSQEKNAGFSTQTPWIPICCDYRDWNVESEQKDKNSVLHFYQQLIAIRKANAALIYGDIVFVLEKAKDLFCYYRNFDDTKFYIECNLSEHQVKRKKAPEGERILSNYVAADSILRPYEAAIYKVK